MPAVRTPRQLALQRLLGDFATFSAVCYPRYRLRGYQLEAAAPILAAVAHPAGQRLVLQFCRQAGKDELLAQLAAFLLARNQRRGGAIVVGAPTFKPQCLVSRRRLLARLALSRRVLGLHPVAVPREGYRVEVGAAAVAFLSAEPSANVRGETADRLLVGNEAQDIQPPIWDARLEPMVASTNAPAVFSGTPWAGASLLARETVAAQAAGTLYRADWQRVALELPVYGDHVRARIAQLGADHPFILTEYCLKELDAAGGLFPPHLVAQLHGDHPRQTAATPGQTYALLLDVGGAAEDQPDDPTARARERRPDSTALTVVRLDLAGLRDPLVALPSYQVVNRQLWTGVAQPALLPQLLDLARNVWRARWFVVDATGLGAGLAAFLQAALQPVGQAAPCTVLPFVFSAASKSKLGWDLLGQVGSGRLKDYADDGAPDTRLFWSQVAACGYTVALGPGRLMTWGVPERVGLDGRPQHDDLLLSLALVALLDEQDHTPRTATGRRYAWVGGAK